jgi:hypothetical protein
MRFFAAELADRIKDEWFVGMSDMTLAVLHTSGGYAELVYL